MEQISATGALTLAHHAEAVGRVADKLDSLVHAAKMGLPSDLHLQAMREALPETVQQLRQAYVGITGQNPWETHPVGGVDLNSDAPLTGGTCDPSRPEGCESCQ